MRIFSAPNQDPVLLDSTTGLSETYHALQDFLNSSRPEFSVSAQTDGNPSPYREFLPGFRISKGGIEIRITIDSKTRELRITGPEKFLRIYLEGFRGLRNTEHCHPELAFQPMDGVFANDCLYPYIEADDHYEVEGYARNA